MSSCVPHPPRAPRRRRARRYNDDIQGTAAVAVAGLLGGLTIRSGSNAGLLDELRKGVYLFHGAGSAGAPPKKTAPDCLAPDCPRLQEDCPSPLAQTALALLHSRLNRLPLHASAVDLRLRLHTPDAHARFTSPHARLGCGGFARQRGRSAQNLHLHD